MANTCVKQPSHNGAGCQSIPFSQQGGEPVANQDNPANVDLKTPKQLMDDTGLVGEAEKRSVVL